MARILGRSARNKGLFRLEDFGEFAYEPIEGLEPENEENMKKPLKATGKA